LSLQKTGPDLPYGVLELGDWDAASMEGKGGVVAGGVTGGTGAVSQYGGGRWVGREYMWFFLVFIII
jgi:hypothetical protein